MACTYDTVGPWEHHKF